MPRGTVKSYNSMKGYGFIMPDDGGRDVFVHAKELMVTGLEALTEGQAVVFDAALDDRSGRVHAVNIQPIAVNIRRAE